MIKARFFSDVPSDQPIALPGRGTLSFSLPLQRQVKAFAMGAHPAELACGNAGHQGMRCDIPGNDCAGG
ncbi:hypothetical protein [Rhabdochromatium marinum]|uniref:hypothetical protein n=1 Tax=Rhabdochromatium marinum TaxID=48729 RepID=UPI001A915984|nr:hypothetical protein [Rhabdochromatium marinum]